MAVVAAPVAAWVTSAAAASSVGVIAASASAIGAVAGSIAVGVVSGAVIGAATSAISGGNILHGALKGAAIGGVTAGVATGLSIATGITTSAEIMSGWGLAADGTKLAADTATNISTGGASVSSATDVTRGLSQGYGSGMDALNGVQTAQNTVSGVDSVANAGNAANVAGQSANTSKGFLAAAQESLKSKETIASGVEGAFKGLGQIGATKMQADSAEDQAKREQERIDKARENNKVGEFEAMVAKIEVPDWWNKYLAPVFRTNVQPQAPGQSQDVNPFPPRQDQGILARGVIPNGNNPSSFLNNAASVS